MNPKAEIADGEIIKLIASVHKLEQDKAFSIIYKKHIDSIVNMVRRNSGSAADGEDIFQDTIVVLYRQVKKGDFTLTCALNTYLYSIARNLWMKKLRKKGRETSLDESDNYVAVSHDVLDVLETDEQITRFAAIINKLGEDCKRILKLFYFDKLKMDDIAEEMNYSSGQVAKNKKSNCLKKLKEIKKTT